MAVIQYTSVKKQVFEAQEVRLYEQITQIKLDPYESPKSVPREPPEAVHC